MLLTLFIRIDTMHVRTFYGGSVINLELQENVRARMAKVSELYRQLEKTCDVIAEQDSALQEALEPLCENIMHLVPPSAKLLVESKMQNLNEILTFLLESEPDGRPKELKMSIRSFANWGFDGWTEMGDALKELQSAWNEVFIVTTRPLNHHGIEITIKLNLK